MLVRSVRPLNVNTPATWMGPLPRSGRELRGAPRGGENFTWANPQLPRTPEIMRGQSRQLPAQHTCIIAPCSRSSALKAFGIELPETGMPPKNVPQCCLCCSPLGRRSTEPLAYARTENRATWLLQQYTGSLDPGGERQQSILPPVHTRGPNLQSSQGWHRGHVC